MFHITSWKGVALARKYHNTFCGLDLLLFKKNKTSPRASWSLRINPLLQGVPQLLSLNRLCQGAKVGLELSDGGRQVLETAACTCVFLQQPPAFSWEEDEIDRGEIMSEHPALLTFHF